MVSFRVLAHAALVPASLAVALGARDAEFDISALTLREVGARNTLVRWCHSCDRPGGGALQ
jgi:hypothetical protein